MDNGKKIEIPFGAFDSELQHQEINIPNGFNAVIKGNKIILTRAESEDEKIRKRIIHALHGDVLDMEETNKALAWLEQQGEQKPIEWDEYDEMYVSALIAIVRKEDATTQILRDTLTGWLRCLKGRFKRNG